MKIGILGGGQLGRMLALAGIPFGHQFRFWEPAPDAPASDVGEIFAADFNDLARVDAFAAGLDCITYEFENIPAELVAALNSRCPVFPSQRSLEVSQDRLAEKTTFRELGLGCAPFCAVDAPDRVDRTQLEKISFPAILKTRRFGYDGKGQSPVASVNDLSAAWDAIGKAPAILEERIRFDAEVSLLCVRGRNGEKKFYPLVENKHREGILASSRVPSSLVTADLQRAAEQCGSLLLDNLNHTGLLTIEFFVTSHGLLINEIAPRVHNSGHWSIEGSCTSQFENHIRAITGAPLGPTDLRGASILLNLVGDAPESSLIQQCNSAHLHLYRKSPRHRRKIGHITLNAAERKTVEADEAVLIAKLEPYLGF